LNPAQQGRKHKPETIESSATATITRRENEEKKINLSELHEEKKTITFFDWCLFKKE